MWYQRWLIVVNLSLTIGTNFSENWLKIRQFLLKKIHLTVSPAKWWPFCSHINALEVLWDTSKQTVVCCEVKRLARLPKLPRPFTPRGHWLGTRLCCQFPRCVWRNSEWKRLQTHSSIVPSKYPWFEILSNRVAVMAYSVYFVAAIMSSITRHVLSATINDKQKHHGFHHIF